jgi:hypothetical protein
MNVDARKAMYEGGLNVVNGDNNNNNINNNLGNAGHP